MMLRLRTGNFGALFSEGVEPEPAPAPAARRLRRHAALRETQAGRARRLLRVVARLAQRRRIADLPATLRLLLREHFARPSALPDPRAPLPGAEGLAGLAVDLRPEAMMEAYGKGLAPSACLGPVAWHSRPERFVATPAALARHHRRRQAGAAAAGWTVTFDHDIDRVLARSGRPREPGPIMPANLLDAFANLFDAGFAHCFAVRDRRGALIGGGFGVAVGGTFMIEGAFEALPGAAAVGLSQLIALLEGWNFALVECACRAAWLDRGLFRAAPRQEFLAALTAHLAAEKIGRWRDDDAAKPGSACDGRLAA